MPTKGNPSPLPFSFSTSHGLTSLAMISSKTVDDSAHEGRSVVRSVCRHGSEDSPLFQRVNIELNLSVSTVAASGDKDAMLALIGTHGATVILSAVVGVFKPSPRLLWGVKIKLKDIM